MHYGDAEHLVDELADAAISKWCPHRGTNLDGTKIEARGCDFYTFRLGKVLPVRIYYSLLVNAD